MQTTQVYAVNREQANCLEVRTTELPAPPAGHARVRVEAAGVSYGDLLFQRGVIPGGPKAPFVPGCDVVGVVESVGDGVTTLRPGDRVAALVVSGGYTTGITLPAERLVPVPDGVDPVNVAAVSLNYFIAYQMLHRVAKVRSGQSILVQGAAGGVGLAFLQLAEHIGGVTVFGTASATNLDVVRRHGAVAVDYRNEDFANAIRDSVGAVDAAFDPIGGPHFWRSYSVLRNRGGRLVAYGQSEALRGGKRNMAVGAMGFLGGIILPNLRPDGRRTGFYNAWALEKKQPRAYGEDLAQVLDLLSADKIAPRSIATLPLRDATEAFAQLERGVTGKLVLTCTE
ncbi:MAG: zinc-binding dehydrogenase [Actinophytocola sp.]|uniref:medium chain dehydrogenase/reductase family protein n=1 Tax=Actinophytocola sp. TaxID=1872138 RepID=UPI001327958C|nr:medium chain dehydrogenase/reductase family protein [Actinophytocola sp.]MPZ81100.1 zinc-binding dehydrogenase [Actinophytocola sp.]